MAKGLVNESSLNSIADAINVLNGSEGTYYPSEMGAAIIDAIPTEEVTDSIVSVTDAAAYPAEGLEFAIEPVQDLHGYDRPWPAGGGKNKVDIADMNITSQTTMGRVTLPSGTYVASATVKNNTSIGGAIKINTSSETLALGGIPAASGASRVSTASFTLSEPTEIVVVVSGALGGYSYDVSQVQIELGSTATSYEPYANECPISGWTGVNGERTGVNVWDEQWEVGALSTVTGEPIVNAGQIRTKNYIPVVGGETYRMVTTTTPDGVWMLFFDNDRKVIADGLPYLGGKASNARKAYNNILISMPSNCSYVRFYFQQAYGTTYNNDTGINYPSTDTSYHAYTGTSIPITFPTEAGTVYGGKVDVVNGKLLAYPEYDSYNGETLTGKWISSIDAYVEGTTPTIGAQVVDLSGVGTEYDITPQQVQMLLGDNNVWCDTGDTTLAYKVDLGRYIEKLQAVQVTPQLSLSRQAVSLDEGAEDVEVSADEPIEESEKAEEMPAEDVESVDVAEDEPAELPVEEDTEAESTESEIWVKEPDTFEKEGDESD